VIVRGNVFTGTPGQAALYRLRGDVLEEVARLPRPLLFSADRRGRLLGRDTGELSGRGPRQDEVRGADGQLALSRDLGHFDCFNHHLRLDGGDALYFLRGTPATSHEGKVLCRIDAAGAVHEGWPWDSAERHLMSSTACLLPDDGLVRAYRVYDPRPGRHTCYLEALELANGRRRWHHPVSALVTSLALVEGKPWLLYALTDGRVGVMDTDTGLDLCETTLALDGVPTMVMAMRAHGDHIACGTVDGRLFLLSVVKR
jgi:hypothetical protein